MISRRLALSDMDGTGDGTPPSHVAQAACDPSPVSDYSVARVFGGVKRMSRFVRGDSRVAILDFQLIGRNALAKSWYQAFSIAAPPMRRKELSVGRLHPNPAVD